MAVNVTFFRERWCCCPTRSLLISQEWINAGSFKHTFRYTHTYIPMTNAFATMPDVEMPLENLRTMYTYMLGEKAFPTLNTSNTKIESRTTKRRPNLQRAGARDRVKSKIYHFQSATIPVPSLSADITAHGGGDCKTLNYNSWSNSCFCVWEQNDRRVSERF